MPWARRFFQFPAFRGSAYEASALNFSDVWGGGSQMPETGWALSAVIEVVGLFVDFVGILQGGPERAFGSAR